MDAAELGSVTLTHMRAFVLHRRSSSQVPFRDPVACSSSGVTWHSTWHAFNACHTKSSVTPERAEEAHPHVSRTIKHVRIVREGAFEQGEQQRPCDAEAPGGGESSHKVQASRQRPQSPGGAPRVQAKIRRRHEERQKRPRPRSDVEAPDWLTSETSQGGQEVSEGSGMPGRGRECRLGMEVVRTR